MRSFSWLENKRLDVIRCEENAIGNSIRYFLMCVKKPHPTGKMMDRVTRRYSARVIFGGSNFTLCLRCHILRP